ncbi:MAG: PilZ domain-containing protein [Eubacteriales bacterium]|nr:PilZ domain-containing protein [Eubacteriales bacterium]
MNDGIEKRRHKRIKADLKLNVSSLFKQNNVEISNIDSPINVTNVSKSGIGFEARSILPVDFYFNAALRLGQEDDVIYCVVKIIRCLPIEDSDMFSYGCEFVGMAPVLNYIFDEYEAAMKE